MPNPVRPDLFFGLALLVLASGSVAFAQTALPSSDQSLQWRHGAAVAGYRTVDALSEASETVEIFVAVNPDVKTHDGRPLIEHLARRTDTTGGQSGAVSWTSTRDCPALRNTLIWLTTLVAPRIEIAGINPGEFDPAGRRPITVYADGLDTTVWGRGTQPDHTTFTRVEMSSNGGLIAQFGQTATENLSVCWRPDFPEM